MIIAEERESSCQYQGKKVSSNQFDEINFIYLLLFWKKYHKEIDFVTSQLCQVGLCKLIRDTLGIWIPLRDFWIPDSNCKRDSGFLELYAGLHKKKIPRFRDTDCLTRGETSVFTSVQEWSAPCYLSPMLIQLWRWVAEGNAAVDQNRGDKDSLSFKTQCFSKQ